MLYSLEFSKRLGAFSLPPRSNVNGEHELVHVPPAELSSRLAAAAAAADVLPPPPRPRLVCGVGGYGAPATRTRHDVSCLGVFVSTILSTLLSIACMALFILYVRSLS